MPIINLPSDVDALQSAMRAARTRVLNNGRARRDWCRVEAKDDAPADVYIYDEIGMWGLPAKDFIDEIRGLKAKQINLHLNTPGGDVFDGIAIHNALRAHPANVHVQVDALAASIGSVIAMAGEHITMAKHATMMIHDPFGFAMGAAADMRKMGDVLDQLGDTIAGVYSERAGGSVREWRDRMLAETWYTDRQAVDAGLADTVDGDPEATDRFDLSVFKHPPEDLVNAMQSQAGSHKPTKREIERVLRDAGLSRDEAKTFIARGYGTEQEDAARDVADLMALRDAMQILRG